MAPRLVEIARLFLKLGTIGFGGPAVHIATMEEEVVQHRGWLTRDAFLDLVGATNLIPGPNSTEMAMHIGYHSAGWRGLLVAGACFIGPATVITTVMAWTYVTFGQTPAAGPLLAGIKPAVLAIVLVAGWRLGRRAWQSVSMAVVGCAAAAASLAGFGQVRTLLLTSLLGMLWLVADRSRTDRDRTTRPGSGPGGKAGLLAGLGVGLSATRLSLAATAVSLAAVGASLTPAIAPSAGRLFLFFFKVGAILYGTGYVLIAYLEGGLVGDYGWLTQDQLLEAIAIGQLTPGPILSAATFIGFVVMSHSGGTAGGLLGAAAATLGIFLPSFGFVVAVNPLIPKLRRNRHTAAFLDAVVAASLGLMAAVALKLCAQTLTHWQSWFIALAAGLAVLRWKVRAPWLVLGGACAGWLFAQLPA